MISKELPRLHRLQLFLVLMNQEDRSIVIGQLSLLVMVRQVSSLAQLKMVRLLVYIKLTLIQERYHLRQIKALLVNQIK